MLQVIDKSLTSHPRDSLSILCQSISGLWRANWQWDKFLFYNFSFPLLTLLDKCFIHNYIHLNVPPSETWAGGASEPSNKQIFIMFYETSHTATLFAHWFEAIKIENSKYNCTLLFVWLHWDQSLGVTTCTRVTRFIKHDKFLRWCTTTGCTKWK